MNNPEAERAVIEMLDGTSKIVIIEIHPEPYTSYPYVELGNGNKAELVKVNQNNVCFYKEVISVKNSLFR